MYDMWPFSQFLVIAGFMFVCTSGNTQGHISYNLKCQGSVMKLVCLNKSYIISIVSVFYGRLLPGSAICRSTNPYQSDESLCSPDQTSITQTVKKICDEQNSCNFTLSADTFGKDYCPKVHKYMDVRYMCVDSQKAKRGDEILRPAASSTPSIAMTKSIVTSRPITSEVASSSSQVIHTSTIQVTRTSSMAEIEKLSTAPFTKSPPRSSATVSSARPHSVSVTSVNPRTQPATSAAINSGFTTTKQVLNTRENAVSRTDHHGTMKLFRFILNFHLIREENIRKNTASSILWFLFGVLVGFFILTVVLVFYRLKQNRWKRKHKPDTVTYFKQKDSSDGTFEEKVTLQPRELEVLEMESQCGESV